MPTATNTRVVPRSGCSMISAIGTPDTAEDDERAACASSSLLNWAITEASVDDHDDLGQLRRLQLERSDLEPGL